jgi:hypothetical protein
MGGGRSPRHGEYAAFLQNAGLFFRGYSQGWHPGLVCDALSAPLTDGVGSVLDRKVYFPLAGYAGPGFHTWPSGHIPQDTAPNPLFRSRSHAKKTFGQAFGAATGVSDPRLQKIRIRNNGAGGKAATVAGYAGPGFHNWPSGHIPQNNGSESASSQPAPCKKDVRPDVRRRDRGQRPTATEDPDTKPTAHAAKPPL